MRRAARRVQVERSFDLLLTNGDELHCRVSASVEVEESVEGCITTLMLRPLMRLCEGRWVELTGIGAEAIDAVEYQLADIAVDEFEQEYDDWTE